MQIVKLSSKFQVVIRKRIREELNLSPGQELQIYVRDGSVRFTRRVRSSDSKV